MMLICCLKFFLGEHGSNGDGNGHDDNEDDENKDKDKDENENDENEDNDEDDSSEAVAGPKVLLAHVDLAKTVCKWLHYLLLPYF